MYEVRYAFDTGREMSKKFKTAGEVEKFVGWIKQQKDSCKHKDVYYWVFRLSDFNYKGERI